MLRPEFDYERPHKHKLIETNYVVRPFHRYLAIPMNITNCLMNVSCDAAALFMRSRSGAYKWTRRDLNPRPPALLESLELSLQSGCSTGLSYAPVEYEEEVPKLCNSDCIFL